MDNRTYICIDLKSFYASVECVELGLDPLTTNLVVADSARTEKTICLAVTPALKSYGIPGRPRLFEVVQAVRNINRERRAKAYRHTFSGKSNNIKELESNPDLELDYIVARPRMAHYMKYSTDIYKIYLKYVSHDDIHVYSIDEVFIDVTGYLNTYSMTARELAMTIIRDVHSSTGITATVGVGSNMYLSKIAMDIVAKHMPPDEKGVRIAELDEMSYRQQLWNHRPLTDFWRIGKGYSKKLEANGMYTMGDVARFSSTEYGQKKLYKLFGINAELLIDHAWGIEPCIISDIKSYVPENRSLGSGQVLHCAYDSEKAKLVIREMAEQLVLELVEKRLVTDQIILDVGYDIENLSDDRISSHYNGEVTTDRYGRNVPKQAHGSINMGSFTSSTEVIVNKTMELFDRITDKMLLVRRMNIAANHIRSEKLIEPELEYIQLDFFTDYEKMKEERHKKDIRLKKERKIQEAMIELKNRFGKNAILKGTNLKEGATAMDRNRQIGGHRE
ncbi:MAG: DNA methylase [Clostridia bacterium]|nr:DNA methylase [Clostridia bacterium]